MQMVREKAEADYIPDFPPPGVTKKAEGTAIMLSTFANDMVRKLSQQAMAGLAQHLGLFPTTLRLGSACSGTDIWLSAVQEVLSAFSEQMATPLNNNLEPAFVCEKNAMKQAWLLNLPHIARYPGCCCFKDVMDLKSENAACARHTEKDTCCVPQDIIGYACGFSCCPYSKLNAKANSNKGVLHRYDAKPEQASEGVDTAVGNIDYVMKARPSFSFMENVEDIDDDVATEGSILQHVESNLKQLRTKFDEEGFLTAVVLMDATEYGLPQARRRIYIIAIPLDHPMLCSPPMAGLSSKIEKAILALKLPTHPLDRFLLPDDDEAVVRELERLEMNKAKAKDKLEKDTKWQEEHQRVFKQQGCLWGQLQPLHDVAKSRWFAAVPPREKDILTLMPVVHKHITRCDTSQGIMRRRPSSSEFCFTCAPGMRAYDFCATATTSGGSP